MLLCFWYKMGPSIKGKLRSILISLFIIIIGLVLLKFVPMELYGKDILFDASMHISVGIFFLYVLWYFIDQNVKWRIPYLVFSLVVVLIIAVQRLLVNAHNDVGLLAGALVALFSIVVSRWNYFKNKFSF